MRYPTSPRISYSSDLTKEGSPCISPPVVKLCALRWPTEAPNAWFLLAVLTAFSISGCSEGTNPIATYEAARMEAVETEEREALAVLRELRDNQLEREKSPDWPSTDKLVQVPINQTLFKHLWHNYDRNLYVQNVVNEDLKSGGVTDIQGLETQLLRFNLPRQHQRCWSKDGKILYIVSPLLSETGPATSGYPQVLRIDASTWTATHAFRGQFPFGSQVSIAGIELTSAGLLVALNGEYTLDVFTKETRNSGPHLQVGVRINHLMLLDLDTLEMKRLFLGPSVAIAGSPDSPVVCVSGRNVIAALIDLRDGTVLDRIDRMNRDKKISGIEWIGDAVMSPNGDVLYCSAGKGVVQLFDVSEGQFTPLSQLSHPGYVKKWSYYDRSHSVYVSPDGSRLAVHCGGTFSVMPTSFDRPPGIDAPTPPAMRARGSYDLTFVGSSNRLAYNSAWLGRQPRYRDLDLSTYSYQLHDKISIQNEDIHMCVYGAPFSDHVLVGIPPQRFPGENTGKSAMTFWVRLPEEAAEPESTDTVEVMPAQIFGKKPDDPLQLLDGPRRDKWDRSVGLARVHIPRDKQLACSPDGNLVYVLDEEGLLRAFDANRLREVRQAQIPKPEADEEYCSYKMFVTKAGILVGEQSEPWVELLDATTLDGIDRFRLDASGDILATSPGSNLIRIRSESNDLEFYDVEAKRLAYRLSKSSASQLPAFKYIGSSTAREKFGRAVIADSGDFIVARWKGIWHCFDIDPDSGLEHRGFLHTGNIQDSDSFPIPLPKLGKCYFISGGVSGGVAIVYDLENLPAPISEFKLRAKLLATAPNGWLYTGGKFNLSVYDDTGERLFSRDVLTQHRGNQASPLPGRPTRVFALGSSLSVTDLDKPKKHFAGLKVWTSGKHQTVAKLVEADKKKAVLESIEGKRISIPLKQLSKEDREFIDAQQKRTKRGSRHRID